MGEAARLVTGLPRLPLMVGFAALSLGLQIFVPYHRYVGILKWLTLTLFAYVLVVLAVGVDWRAAMAGLWPSLPAGSATTVVAILGTTISPYLFFWQSAQELEEMNLEHARPLLQRPRAAPHELTRLMKDSAGGFLVTMIISLCIIAATDATLHGTGTTTIATAADAAAALRPIAGDFASPDRRPHPPPAFTLVDRSHHHVDCRCRPCPCCPCRAGSRARRPPRCGRCRCAHGNGGAKFSRAD